MKALIILIALISIINDTPSITVYIDSEGSIFIEDKPVKLKDFEKEINVITQNFSTVTEKIEYTFILKVEPQAKMKYVSEVREIMREKYNSHKIHYSPVKDIK